MMGAEARLPDWLIWPLLVLLGAVIGAFGTIIGAGGGFVLVPVLLLLYPDDQPELIASISLAVVFFNALSGTVAYARQRRIDYLAGNAFALATLPGAVAGAFAVRFFARGSFDGVFALVLALASATLLVRLPLPIVQRRHRKGEVTRQITDAAGDTYAYSYNLIQGLAVSLAVGFMSSLLGIGGGIIHVPAMILLLRFPAHLATATSHYVLMWSALAGTVVHLAAGHLDGGYGRVAALSVGVLAGAQIGARLSQRLRTEVLRRLLSLALIAVAARLMLKALGV
ncbi:MAG TPA: sulfite exporter TauE/SafE family protein [Dehalococcoidia bacterium]|nr:sulfite exporter TauE/SafE family protein [Dehalococcoidia bacterium]